MNGKPRLNNPKRDKVLVTRSKVLNLNPTFHLICGFPYLRPLNAICLAKLFYSLCPVFGLPSGVVIALPIEPVILSVAVGSDLTTLPHNAAIVGGTFFVFMFVVLMLA